MYQLGTRCQCAGSLLKSELLDQRPSIGSFYSLKNILWLFPGVMMAHVDFEKTPVVEPDDSKIFGTVETAVDFATTFGNNVALKRALSALQRGPVRFYRDNVIVGDEAAAEYLFFVVSGVVRSCKVFDGGARPIVAFYLPGDLFGLTDLKRSRSIEAATDTAVLFLKRNALLSLAARETRVASFLLSATTNELESAQEHILLKSKLAKCRVATFLRDLWVRLGQPKYLEVPMSYQDIADYLGLCGYHAGRLLSLRLKVARADNANKTMFYVSTERSAKPDVRFGS
jgi:CRP/FNR family transcriptional regulator, nitrogen fixation regulation protein